MNSVKQVRRVYMSLLHREPDLEGGLNAIKMIENGGTLNELVKGIIDSDEYKALQLKKKKNLMKNSLKACDGLTIEAQVEKVYNIILQRTPDVEGRQHMTKDLKNGSTLSNIVKRLLSSDEYQRINTIVPDFSFDYERTSKYTVKYIGIMDSSGYSRAGKLLVRSLIAQGVDVIFKAHKVVDESLNQFDKQILSLHSDRDYDVLIIHTLITDWKLILDIERINHGYKPVYGINVWETDEIPKEWIPLYDMVNIVSVPNRWNKEVYQKRIDVPIETLYHPIYHDIKEINSSNKRDVYTFYTISEWRERKGITDVINCYLEEFTKKDNVVLYVKTFAFNIKPLMKWLNDQLDNTSPKIVINTDIVTDDIIDDIHRSGDCYVTLAKAEGQGLGACEAVMYNKPIITNSYGAQSEYIKGAFNVSYDMIPAIACDFTSTHDICRGKSYCVYAPEYDSSYQNWSQPNLEEAKQLMRWVYENDIREGNPFTKKYIENFTLEKVGANLNTSLQQLLMK